MNIEEIRDFCLSLPETTESFPFGDDTLVMKTGGKMFAFMNLEGPLRVNVKCEPEKAVELRETYADVLPGYHMNKLHWNTLNCAGSLNDSDIRQWITDSYFLVKDKGRKKGKRRSLK